MRAAQASRPIRVNIYYSPQARSYWANSPDLDGLAASGSTREEVEQEARWAAESLLELNGAPGPRPELQFQDAVFQAE
jgi:predicted RNase H-like HicB family nuclease